MSAPTLLPRRALVAFVGLLGLPAGADAAGRSELQDTVLMTRSLTGGLPNGASGRPAVSGDSRDASVLAWESDASDLVAGDHNGQRDVFLMRRARPFAHNGTAWGLGPNELVSRGLGGHPADGPSWAAAVNGDLDHAPSCVAFLSAASNLVPGDTNGQVDAYVYRLATRRVQRVSLGRARAQLHTPVFEVAADAACARVAFVSSAPQLPRANGHRQVYVRHLRTGKLTVASGVRGHAGNGDAGSPSFAQNGPDMVFSSTATDLTRRANGQRQTYLRTARNGRLAVLSRTETGEPGDGASDRPVLDERRAPTAAFQTRASNLAGAPGGIAQVVRTVLGDGELQNVSDRGPHAGDGDSERPRIGNGGHYVTFDSVAANLRPHAAGGVDGNGARDVFLYTAVRDTTLVQSRSSLDAPLPASSGHPAPSYFANYVFFESVDPTADRSVPGAASTGPRQIFQRYLGPA